MAAETKAKFTMDYRLRSSASELSLPSTPPDIYLVILDAYAGNQALQEVFGFDNHTFIKRLEQMGFYVPRCAQSNYALTTLSVPSILQMSYVNEFGLQLIKNNADWRDFSLFIRYNSVRYTLEDLGYKIVAFDTSNPWTNLPDAAVYYEKPENIIATIFDFEQLNPFEKLLTNTTAIKAARALFPQRDNHQTDEQLLPAHSVYLYETMQYMLEKLPEIPTTIQGPKFVYIHLYATHYPYIVNENGDLLKNTNEGDYISAVKYVNQELLAILPQLIEGSPNPPIILLQADHGFTYVKPQHRMETFAAYYLPEYGNQHLYNTITPVNLFRLIFNTYFDGSFALKEDRSYFSINDQPYNWIEVPNDQPECQSR